MSEEELERSAKKARDNGQLLTREQLAWFWQVDPRHVDELRRKNIIKPAIPREKDLRYSLSLINGLPEFEVACKKKARSLKTKKTEKSSDKQGESLWLD